MKYKDYLVRHGEILAPRNYWTFSTAEENAYEKRLNKENKEEGGEDDEDANEHQYILHWEE